MRDWEGRIIFHFLCKWPQWFCGWGCRSLRCALQQMTYVKVDRVIHQVRTSCTLSVLTKPWGEQEVGLPWKSRAMWGRWSLPSRQVQGQSKSSVKLWVRQSFVSSGEEGKERTREGLVRLPGQRVQGQCGSWGLGPKQETKWEKSKSVLPPQHRWWAVGG